MFTFAFEKLEVWKHSREFVSEIYRITRNFPKNEIFGLSSQIRRASISIASNLAEGSSRKSTKDQLRFTTIAFSSSLEVLNHLIISKDLSYISDEEYQLLREKLEKITNMLNALSNAQKSRL